MPDNMGIKLCGRCNEELPKDGEYAHRRLCSGEFHFGKCSIRIQSWKALGKNGQEKCTCVACRKKETPKSKGVEDTSETWSRDIGYKRLTAFWR